MKIIVGHFSLLFNERHFSEVNKFLVSKETVVLLHQWEIETRKFGFIKQVDKGQITAVKDLEK